MLYTSLQPVLGKGIYTISDVAHILQLDNAKVRRVLQDYWNSRFVEDGGTYSWGDKHQAVNFYTMMEFYIFYQLRRLNISTRKILKAHTYLSDLLQTPYPFADARLLTDGRTIFFEEDVDSIIAIDGKDQRSFRKIMIDFCKKIEFGDQTIAKKFWPLSKNKSVVIDPEHQFGQPIVDGTNIRVETIFELFKAGESIDRIANLYEISHSSVKDAIAYCQAA
jgi:uncharacterized protein (DUF433 family)